MGVVFVVHDDLTSQALEGFFPVTEVCIGTGLRAGWPRNRVRFLAWLIAIFCIHHGFTGAQSRARAHLTRVNRTGLEAVHSPASNVEVNAWRCTSTSSYAVWSGA